MDSIYDACGLVSPQALLYLPVPMTERLDGGVGARGTAFVKATTPDYVVTMPVFSCKSIDIDPWFQGNYELIREESLPAELWGSTGVLVYARKASTASLGSDP